MSADTLHWKLPESRIVPAVIPEPPWRRDARLEASRQYETVQFPASALALERAARDDAARTWRRWITDFRAWETPEDELTFE
jgi:hypothetical protein